jgi:hypothetical protein
MIGRQSHELATSQIQERREEIMRAESGVKRERTGGGGSCTDSYNKFYGLERYPLASYLNVALSPLPFLLSVDYYIAANNQSKSIGQPIPSKQNQLPIPSATTDQFIQLAASISSHIVARFRFKSAPLHRRRFCCSGRSV